MTICPRYGTVTGLPPVAPHHAHVARWRWKRMYLVETRGRPPDVLDFAGRMVDGKEAAAVLAALCVEWAAAENADRAGTQAVLL